MFLNDSYLSCFSYELYGSVDAELPRHYELVVFDGSGRESPGVSDFFCSQPLTELLKMPTCVPLRPCDRAGSKHSPEATTHGDTYLPPAHTTANAWSNSASSEAFER